MGKKLSIDYYTDAEKKEFLGSFIERIEINPEPTVKGQILKKIKFRIPICYNGNTVTVMNFLFRMKK